METHLTFALKTFQPENKKIKKKNDNDAARESKVSW